MKEVYPNTLGSERTVELQYMYSSLEEHCESHTKILDVGGIPSNPAQMSNIYDLINSKNLNYKVSDFRGGEYPGDFVTLDFQNDKFDFIIFLSSLEHFPQCTEGPDMTYREGEDRKGFQKALSLLEREGLILLTVPFGKQRWQPYHQNYDMEGIRALTKGSRIIEQYTYSLLSNDDSTEEWKLTDPNEMKEILYTDRAYGCGQFLLQKSN